MKKQFGEESTVDLVQMLPFSCLFLVKDFMNNDCDRYKDRKDRRSESNDDKNENFEIQRT